MEEQGYLSHGADQVKSSEAGALQELDAWLDEHEKALDVLRGRLSPVLSMDSPSAVEDVGERDSRSELRARSRRLRELTEQVQRLTARVDL